MTTKSAPCLARARAEFPQVESSRTIHDGLPRHASLTGLITQPWMLRAGTQSLLVRPSGPRDLPQVAAMHGRCSPQTLLDRYRSGGRGPAVVAMERMLRRPLAYVATTRNGEVVALAVACIDAVHDRDAAEVGLMVEDRWQGLGVGRELAAHLAGAALVCGYTELIAYTATSVVPAQRIMIDVGHTRVVADSRFPHLHTYLPEAAALGLGAVRERLAS